MRGHGPRKPTECLLRREWRAEWPLSSVSRSRAYGPAPTPTPSTQTMGEAGGGNKAIVCKCTAL